MTEFSRSRGAQRFTFAGMKLNALPDALAPGKFPLAINVRATQDDALVTRPGQTLLFAAAGALPFTDIRTYSALGTDNFPRILARDTADAVWLGEATIGGTATQVGTLAPGGLGASMLPFRPNASPTPWMYVANGADYQKFSAPSPTDAVVAAKVGIAEPQTAPEASLSGTASVFVDMGTDAPPFTQDGTMGDITTADRTTDTVVAAFPDPAAGRAGSTTTSLQVSSDIPYQRFQKLLIGAAPIERFIQDVFTPIPASFISAIYYFAGTTGRCVVVPGGPAGYSQGPGATSDSLYGALLLSSLRRGALVQIGDEVCFVLSATEGPNNTVSFETITTEAHTTADALIGVSAIQVFDAQTTAPGDALSSPIYLAQVTAGLGSATAVLGTDTSEQLRPTAYTNPSPFEVIPPNTPWGNPASAFDGDPNTWAFSSLGELNHSSCQWQSWPSPSFAYNTINLYVDSEVPPPSGDGSWSAILQVSFDGGGTFYTVYNAGGDHGSGARGRQIDLISVPPGTDITSQLIVRASVDTLHNVSAEQFVYEISLIGVSAGPFTSPFILQPDDYVHVSINVDDLSMLTEMKLIFEIDADNYYYYTIRPSDLAAAVANTQTQIAAAQVITQRATIDQLDAAAAFNQAQTSSSAQTPPGSAQWAEIVFPISSFTRVGNDQSKSLADAVNVALLFNASGTINVIWNSIYVFGGFQADVGDVGSPYLYRARPRSQATGVVGNPSPATRYGCSPRRQQITVNLPDATYDTQIDTWDIFRYGGTVTSWRYIGSTPSTNTQFPDNYDDTAADAGLALDFDNFEPWPTVDLPNNGMASVVNGTVAIVTSPTPDIERYLPGTLVQLGGLNVYTLWTRPTGLSSGIYLLQFVENAGAAMNVPFAIQEPALARQPLPYTWGPDASGTVFACGDPLRPGTLYFSKGNNPDSAPDSYNDEITPPSEPLLGGEVLDGLSLVGSSERWWALYPAPSSPSRYNIVQQPIPRGIAAPRGHCTDGVSIFFWAKDGIWSSTKGSLTDADLYNIFPHDGVVGVSVTYAGVTILPPDYSRTGAFRLEYSNSYLYATYQDAEGAYHTLTLDLLRMAWSIDVYSTPVCAFHHPEQQAGTVLTSTNRYPELLMATIDGRVASQTAIANDLDDSPIPVTLATREDPCGDIRAPKQWGDVFLDSIPGGGGLSVLPVSQGMAVGLVFLVDAAGSGARVRRPIAVDSGNPSFLPVISDFQGLLLSWSDDFDDQSYPTTLYAWQISFVVQPAKTIAWNTFGTAFGLDGYMHIREIAVAWVSEDPIVLTITSFDGQSPAPLVIPSSGGIYKKVMFPLTANKGQLYRFEAASGGQFQFFLDEWETHVGQWRRPGAYASVNGFGGRIVDDAAI